MVPRRQQFALTGAFVLMALAGVAGTWLPLLSGKIVDRVQSGVAGGEPRAAIFAAVAVLLAGITGLVFAREVLGVVRRYLVEKACTRIERETTVEVVRRLMQADLSALTHEKVGALHGRVFRSVGGYMRLLRLSFLEFFPAVIVGTLSVGVAVAKQPLLGLAMGGIIPLSLGLTVWQLISQRRVRLQLLRVHEEMDGTVVEQLGGLDYIRVANTHAWELDRVGRAAGRKRDKELDHHIAMSFFGAGKALVEGLFHVGVLAFASYLAIHGDITFGDILTFSMLYLGAMAPLNEVHRVLDEGHEASLQVLDLQRLLAMPLDRSFAARPQPFSEAEEAAPVVKIEGLRVEYPVPDGGRRVVLADVNLEVYPGETVGIAGKTGCGKSTWLKVLTRLLHPDAGRVWLKGRPIADVARESISQLVGYVGQNPFIFAGTIGENITYGLDRECTEDEVHEAARLAAIHNEIVMMPNGYRSPVAEKGQNLSGGQKQRLALARVLLRNPPILILDEAASALDPISERIVQRAIGTAKRDRTVIMVAHRLSTFVDANRILVFDDGRVVETGSYTDLISQNGLFAELVKCSEVTPAT
ncbi:ABC transporter ATP-binding protein [Limnoglobus roseus]|nr:ABC transporter ATP-binding protein [Limnoglobus roseus]